MTCSIEPRRYTAPLSTPTRSRSRRCLSIKTGGCPEDCAYCPQSAHFTTGVTSQKLMPKAAVLAEADRAGRPARPASAWARPGAPRDSDVEEVAELVAGVKALGLETCATLGMLTPAQARRLKQAGLDYYNHNLDTSESYYERIISTRTYHDRLETLAHVREAGIRVCCGGILGMGESVEDDARCCVTLANLPAHPESVPINLLGARRRHAAGRRRKPSIRFHFVRTIAIARILMPASFVRLSAGRESMSDELQALCFLAGANSIFYGEKLLTTPNPSQHSDRRLFERLGLRPLVPEGAGEHSGTGCVAKEVRRLAAASLAAGSVRSVRSVRFGGVAQPGGQRRGSRAARRVTQVLPPDTVDRFSDV